MDNCFSIYRYVSNNPAPENELVKRLTLGDDPTLVKQAIDFLELLGLLKKDGELMAISPLKEELPFRVEVLGRVRKNDSDSVKYLMEVARRLYGLDALYAESDVLLTTLRSVRRDLEIGRGEAAEETGKLEIMKPMLVDLGIISKAGSGRDTRFFLSLDPAVLAELLRAYSSHAQDGIQLYDFLTWVDGEYLPTLDEDKIPFKPVLRGILAAEKMSMVRLTNPADFRKKVNLGSREASRIELLP